MRSKKLPAIDLHGCTTDEVFDLLDQFIRSQKNQDQVCVIVGKGKGLVKEKVLEYLKMAHYPWSYEKIRGMDNQGALLIDLY